jgi:mRNA-degrading endonuclease RelE of RelBE toxin-antitoxin system
MGQNRSSSPLDSFVPQPPRLRSLDGLRCRQSFRNGSENFQCPPHAGYPLHGRLHGLYSLRVGSYRIIYQLSDNDKTVRVATIRHRSVAYSSDPR